jgi:hypothetical protein
MIRTSKTGKTTLRATLAGALIVLSTALLPLAATPTAMAAQPAPASSAAPSSAAPAAPSATAPAAPASSAAPAASAAPASSAAPAASAAPKAAATSPAPEAQALSPGQPENVCTQCHAALPGRLGEPVNLWRQSVHAENGIGCNSCHGGDPKNAADAMNRAKGFLGAPKEPDIPAFCGRCHPGVLKDYLASAHGRALGKGGPTCITCHSNHKVLRASLNIINQQTCTQCHTFERAQTIKTAMQQTEGYIVNADARITDYQSKGVDVERLSKELFSVRNQFHTLFHEVNVGKVRSQSNKINGELAKIDKDLSGIDETMRSRKIAGGIAIAFVLVIAFLVHLLKKTYD